MQLTQSAYLPKFDFFTGMFSWFFAEILRNNYTLNSSFSLKLNKILLSFPFIYLENFLANLKFPLKSTESELIP